MRGIVRFLSVLRRDHEPFSDNFVSISCIYSRANPWRDLGFGNIKDELRGADEKDETYSGFNGYLFPNQY